MTHQQLPLERDDAIEDAYYTGVLCGLDVANILRDPLQADAMKAVREHIAAARCADVKPL